MRIDHKEEDIVSACAKKLRLGKGEIEGYSIVRRSLDARDKGDIHYVFTVDVKAKNEDRILSRNRDRNICKAKTVRYSFAPSGGEPVRDRIIIAGFGPAGLFCGYMLARAGYRPLILERGADIDERVKLVDSFWETGKLDVRTNVQFGEGGAGTFSDGKLNTGVRDDFGRIGKVLEIFTEHGAPEEIRYSNKPHIGTDKLRTVVKSMREDIISHGGEIRFGTAVTGLVTSGEKICAVKTSAGDEIGCDALVLAIGHSARDTFVMLKEAGICLESKAFAMGVRVEHPQDLINTAMYGENADKLPPADYKLTFRASDGRGVYSFCMCPGGFVVNASSEEGRLCVNGMSNSDRSEPYANSAVVVTVSPEDFGNDDPLCGMYFQRELEEKAFSLAGGKIPVQSFPDFREHVRSCIEKETDAKTGTTAIKDKTGGEEADKDIESDRVSEAGTRGKDEFELVRTPGCKGGYSFARVDSILPGFMRSDIVEAMEDFGRKLPGFDGNDALMLGLESRTSSPVRIKRDENFESMNMKNLYPCGEGAGYAGGITSAAADGIKVYEAIASRFCAI